MSFLPDASLVNKFMIPDGIGKHPCHLFLNDNMLAGMMPPSLRTMEEMDDLRLEGITSSTHF
jgi:hypothetical protein